MWSTYRESIDQVITPITSQAIPGMFLNSNIAPLSDPTGARLRYRQRHDGERTSLILMLMTRHSSILSWFS